MKEVFYTVDDHSAGQRLDRFLACQNPQCSRSQITEAIRQGFCQVDTECKKRPDLRLKAGQTLSLTLPEPQTELAAEEGPVDICFQDQRLCVVNKPAGLTVHPCPSCPQHTLIQRLLAHFPALAHMEGARPGIVHRLDKDTSGLLLVAFDDETRLAISELFAKRHVRKEYLALVSGECAEQGECLQPIGRDPQSRIKMTVLPENKGGKAAHSQWQRLWLAPDKQTSLLAVRIHTGRTHQIRVHMAHLGHPLLGDKLYAPSSIAKKAPRQMLHAHTLSFSHPWSGEMITLHVPPPSDFCRTALNCAHQLQKVVITGNPGSGKSSLTNILQNKGFATFSADAEVKKLYARGGQVASWLQGHGGRDVVSGDGEILRDALFALFKANPLLKRDLETMLHASVHEALLHFFASHAADQVAFAEIPLFFECGWRDSNIVTVCVFCPQAERFSRLLKNRGWDLEKAGTIDSWQWPETKKAQASDFVLDNRCDLAHLEQEAEHLLHELCLRRQNTDEHTAETLALLLGLTKESSV